MKFQRWLVGLIPLGVGAAVALVLLSSGGETPLNGTESAQLAPGGAAMRAAIDPETGELVTGPEAQRFTDGSGDKALDAEMEHMLSRSTEGLQPVYHPDGRVSVHLDGRFMNASVARIGADGRVETLCAEDRAEAEAFLNPATQTDANGWEVR